MALAVLIFSEGFATDDYKILNDAVRIRPKSLHEGNNYQTGIRTAGADHFFQHCTTRGIEKPVL